MLKDTYTISDYPEISLILWDWRIDTIEQADLFEMLKIRLKYLYQDRLSQTEIDVIEALCHRYNNGVSLLDSQ
jgi:hypothetical protein